MECLHCGKNIDPIRKLRDQEYCSNSHREAHRKKLNALALDFLLKTKPHFALAKSPSIFTGVRLSGEFAARLLPNNIVLPSTLRPFQST